MNKKKRTVAIGNRIIGGGHPVLIQSMTNTRTADIEATVNQILALEAAGCELVRVTVNDMDAAQAIGAIRKRIHIPLIADIHFDHRLALEAIDQGIDKIRLNPGNIGAEWKVREVVERLRERQVPVRIGVNSGSVERDLVEAYGGPTPQAMLESVTRHVEIFEKMAYDRIVLSLKSSDVRRMVQAYELTHERFDYPLHLGVTEAGTVMRGAVKSAMGIGALLLRGIGDTVRVTLTADPIEEIPVAKYILQNAGLRRFGIQMITCPTCGRTEIDLIPIVEQVEKALDGLETDLTVAIMGCIVNGPGEAREADIGIAGGKGEALLFKKGVPVRKIREERIVEELLAEIRAMSEDK